MILKINIPKKYWNVMKNTFFNKKINEENFKSFIKNIDEFKVGFYSVGLYPASLAYNCAMHSYKKNILLAPRPGRDLLGAFSKEVLSNMDTKIIEKILAMGSNSDSEDSKFYNLKDLILNCNIVILSSNSNHIVKDINTAINLKKNLNRENVVLTCLVGSFCLDEDDKLPFIICEKFPELAFFTGFHRHGALRNNKDSFSANFCHPDSLTALLGTKILNQLSPKINVSPGVHNIECQYIKAIKNVSSIFAGFVNSYHSDKPGMLPTINSVLLSQCFDQAAKVSFLIRKKHLINDNLLSLQELGYGSEKIKGENISNKTISEQSDYTFSQLNAVTADVLGSMTLPIEGKPTRNFQAGQVLSDMFFKFKRCPKNVSEYLEYCKKNNLSEGGLEGLKSLKLWPNIYNKYFIKNNHSSMINLIYLCFYGSDIEKKDIFHLLTNSKELIDYSQESVKTYGGLEIRNNLSGINILKDFDKLYTLLFTKEVEIENINICNNSYSTEEPTHIKVIKIVNKYFAN